MKITLVTLLVACGLWTSEAPPERVVTNYGGWRNKKQNSALPTLIEVWKPVTWQCYWWVLLKQLLLAWFSSPVSQVLTFMTTELRQLACVLLFSVTRMSASGTRSVAGVRVHVNNFSALRSSLTLHLGNILSPGAASNPGEETSQLFFLTCCTYNVRKNCLDCKVHGFSGKLWNPSIACWRQGTTVHRFYKETEAFCCCPVNGWHKGKILKNQAGGVRVHVIMCACCLKGWVRINIILEIQQLWITAVFI